MHVIPAEQIREDTPGIGAKTRRLATLLREGFPVPPFVGVPAGVMERIAGGDQGLLVTVIQEVMETLPPGPYAVRSSALAEDDALRSMAGMFRTVLDQPVEQLDQAVMAVAEDAAGKLSSMEGTFSVIIQTHVPALVSGVTFTRHPLGGREMVVEFHRGMGEPLVGGQVRPDRVRFYWSQPLPHAGLPHMADAAEMWKRMEGLFGFPQDIEWCVAEDGLWILQSRPLTSIQPQQYAEALELDTLLSGRGEFLYEKTEICEVAPRPTPVTFSLLHRLYARGGPVARAYGELGVRFQPRPFLLLLGSELYVDREEEIRSFFPALSLLTGDDRTARPVRLRGLLTTSRNQRALAAIDPGAHLPAIRAECQRLAQTEAPVRTLREEAEAFCDAYAFIARLNVLAAKAVRDLEAALEDETVSAAAVLGGIRVAEEEESPPAGEGELTGNTLELMDATPFFRAAPAQAHIGAVDRWWAGVRSGRRGELKALTETALTMSRLREQGRWLSVRGVNRLRSALFRLAEECEVPPDEAFFVTLTEWEGAVPDGGVRQGRRDAYERAAGTTFPPRLTSRCPPEEEGRPLGVSPGVAEGTLVTLQTLQDAKGPVILWTPILSPELGAILPRLAGIISAQGGLLSHLSIIAREQGVPVIVGVPLETSGLSLGQTVRVDGWKGEVSGEG